VDQALIALTNFTIILAFRKEIRRRKALNAARKTTPARSRKESDRQAEAKGAGGKVLRPEVIRPAAPPQLQRKR